MLYKAILSNFEKELNEIKKSSNSILEEAHYVYGLCNRVLEILKKSVEKNSFKNKTGEIHFFKTVKVVPMKF